MGRSPTRVLAFGMAAALLATPASAQWSITGFFGNASTAPADLTIRSKDTDTELDLGPVSFADESSRSPWYYGWRVTRGFEQCPWLGIEAEFIHAKAISDPNEVVRVRGRISGQPIDLSQALGSTLPRFELSHGLNVLMGNAVLHWPIVRRNGQPLVEIVGRAGAGPGIPHVEATFMGHSTDRYELGGWAIAGSVGADIRLSSRLSAVVDLAWTRAMLRLDLVTADLNGDFTTRHIIGGVTWRFRAQRQQP